MSSATADAEPAAALRDVSLQFGSLAVVDGVTCELPRGSFTAVVGPSGCGKTSLLRLLGGLQRPTRGTVVRARGPVGVCFQEPRLLPWRNLLDNVALPLELTGVAAATRHRRATQALELVQLADAAQRWPHELSGGMRMRAALARALVAEPTLLLLDEPFAALDEVTRQELDLTLHRLWRQQRFTAVLVTHSLPEAVLLAERVLVCSPRPARLLADLPTPGGERDRDTWTSAAHNDTVRAASAALHAGIAEARA